MAVFVLRGNASQTMILKLPVTVRFGKFIHYNAFIHTFNNGSMIAHISKGGFKLYPKPNLGLDQPRNFAEMGN